MQDLLLKANIGGVRLIVSARYSLDNTSTDGVRRIRHLTVDKVIVEEKDEDIAGLISDDTLEELESAAWALAAQRRAEVAYV